MKRISYSLKFLISFIAPFLFLSARAQETIYTDRPDQSDGASVVAKGKFQLESSFIYAKIKDSAASYISSTLLRYGLFKGFELRAAILLLLHPFRYVTVYGLFDASAWKRIKTLCFLFDQSSKRDYFKRKDISRRR